jgi:hypothetical protein
MQEVAGKLHLDWTAAGLAEVATLDAQRSGNRQAEAYDEEHLGVLQLQLGRDREANTSFTEANRLLLTLGGGTARNRYLADFRADRAPPLAQKQGLATAVATLQQDAPIYDGPDAFTVRMRFETAYGTLLRTSLRYSESLSIAWNAVVQAEAMRPALVSGQDRHAWLVETTAAYELLTLDLAQMGQPDLALRAWEWTRTAPFRTPVPLPSMPSLRNLQEIFPALPRDPGSTLLVFARLQDRSVAWSVPADSRGPIAMHDLGVAPDSLALQVAAFRHLCSDPHASTAALTALGDRLYAQLILPFQAGLASAGEVRLDLEAPLADLPFAALSHRGHLFGLDHPLLFLEASWTLSPPDPGSETLPPHPSLLIVNAVFPSSLPRIPDEFNEAGDLQKQVPGARVEQASLRRSQSTLDLNGSPALPGELAHADILHYSGHGLGDPAPNAANPPATAFALTPGSLPHLKLAVLAACGTATEREETAKDDPSFERVFLSAGTSHVLATQWDVDSATTRLLMMRFYLELAHRQPLSQALRRAQLWLYQRSTSVQPYFWAAFRLVGG